MRKIIGLTKVSAKFLITLPKNVREQLKVSRGGSLVWILEDKRIYVQSA